MCSLRAKVRTSCEVKSIETRVDELGVRRVAAVHTARGERVRTPLVLLCTGLWSQPALSLLDCAGELPFRALRLPIGALLHSYLMTDGVPVLERELHRATMYRNWNYADAGAGEQNCFPNIRDHDASSVIRARGGAFLVARYEEHPTAVSDKQVTLDTLYMSHL